MDKWRRIQADITKDLEVVAQCQAGKPCPATVQRLVSLSLEGHSQSGRASGGLLNRAVDLVITPVRDETQRGLSDHWSDPLETLHSDSGDCEDYAIVKEIRQDRDEVSAAKPDRSSRDQFADRSGVFAGGGALGLDHISENPLARGKIGASCLGKGELAARPVEQFSRRWDSSSEILRLTVGSGVFNCRAAAESPLVSIDVSDVASS
ncbi:transglutaminase-like cysteine peptidase [Bradyrhizobium cenepequi]|uniref:transglutaminase-like cysteine peptidase n=1 Tax=Bradyrhizobium cenepequi TaxID=2821403 RepID=UPI001CE300FB|nr:transglutaminase-like cysteine peptidase [Bradyrhizobium cenepequi]MCA6108354.1 hypothetical protein [Bradyrhizobium cenepequi]